MRRRLTRAESRERTREDLLTAAATVFAARGFTAASVEEVAETAGYSKGAVYSNFAGKADLFLALLDRQIEQSRPGWAAAFAAGTSLHERVEAVAQMLPQGAEHECAWTMLELEFFLYAMREPEARAKFAERYRTIRSAMAEHLERHFADRGSTPPIPLHQLVWVLSAIELGLQVQACLDPAAVPDGLWAAAQFPIVDGPRRD